MNRFLLASLVAIGTAGGVASTAASASGLAIGPAILERDARTGSVGTIRVVNNSKQTLAITAGARPWVQSRSGSVTADAKRTLAPVRLGVRSFTLAPGAKRSIPVTLGALPRAGSLYGVVEVIGTPTGPRPANGVVARYRMLSALRLNPPKAKRTFKASVGAARLSGGAVTVAVRNRGNTVQPLTGSVRISGAAGTVRGSISRRRILPGTLLDVPVYRGRLQPGTYRVAVTLRQGGRRVASVTRTLRVK
ncbi:MAG TPA: hypothetical protein VFB41_03875 [Solirubrobacteraceae bacterium]|nr:hypothetical protein [Solirubrobacteraceae bacterium]